MCPFGRPKLIGPFTNLCYGSKLPTSLICIRLISRGYSPWRPDADIGTDAVTRVLHLTVRVFNVPVPSGKLRESDGARARQETPHNAPLPVLSDSRARFTCSVWPEQIFTPQTAWYWAFPQLVALPRTGPVGVPARLVDQASPKRGDP